MTAIPGPDRRRYARLDLRSRVRVSLPGAEGEFFAAEGRNIGVEGICINTGVRLREGDLLDLEIFLPGRPEGLKIKGEVRWSSLSRGEDDGSQTCDAGIRFLSIDKNHLRLMVAYVCGSMGAEAAE